MTKTKKIEEKDEENDNGGIILVYPTFHLQSDPDNIFAISDMLWIMPWTPDPTKYPDELIPKIKAVASKAFEMRQIGIIHTGEYFYIRDLEKEFMFGTLTHPYWPETVNMFWIKGPKFDEESVKNNKVTIH